MSHVKITSAARGGTVEVDGENISAGLHGVSVRLNATTPAEVTLDLHLPVVEFDGEADIYVSGATRDTLRALGWTPPVQPSGDGDVVEQTTQELLKTWRTHAKLGTKASPEEHCRSLAKTLADAGLLRTEPQQDAEPTSIRFGDYTIPVRTDPTMPKDAFRLETTAPCPTCSGPSRETVGMVCQTCGTDYGKADSDGRV